MVVLKKKDWNPETWKDLCDINGMLTWYLKEMKKITAEAGKSLTKCSKKGICKEGSAQGTTEPQEDML